jgi:K+/H+ antiporter YhaU regulatory subunit KhtT
LEKELHNPDYLEDYQYIACDATEDENLIKAGIHNGKSIADSKIRSDFNTIIVGIYRSSGKLIYNPGSETMIKEDDNLIVIGERDKLDKLQEKANES